MFKLLYNWAHVTASKVMLKTASTIHELRTSRYTSWVSKRQRNQRSNCQHFLLMEKAREFQKNISFCFIDYTKAFDFSVDHNKLENC